MDSNSDNFNEFNNRCNYSVSPLSVSRYIFPFVFEKLHFFSQDLIIFVSEIKFCHYLNEKRIGIRNSEAEASLKQVYLLFREKSIVKPARSLRCTISTLLK